MVEAANPRHEHEWQIWQEVKLPDDKILIPGVVSHCVHLVEHPELVAQRIVRFADVVGRERVIAGTDCGFGTSGAGDEVHPDVAWAKLARAGRGREDCEQEVVGRLETDWIRSCCVGGGALPLPACGERVGVRGSLQRASSSRDSPHPDRFAARPLPASGER